MPHFSPVLQLGVGHLCRLLDELLPIPSLLFWLVFCDLLFGLELLPDLWLVQSTPELVLDPQDVLRPVVDLPEASQQRLGILHVLGPVRTVQSLLCIHDWLLLTCQGTYVQPTVLGRGLLFLFLLGLCLSEQELLPLRLIICRRYSIDLIFLCGSHRGRTRPALEDLRPEVDLHPQAPSAAQPEGPHHRHRFGAPHSCPQVSESYHHAAKR
mmetsp:Transcript_88182/g.158993  ORF Transcript_88182/g.158993 Transcript_88182/m.158993 type:complete len:211 (+) Transcript_88182:309-941(+)